ncbi:MAG: hypothetical protein HY520_03415 [Candidatus Aenigmarchaeota archaeon]|nr:hypothetical protein [Candidatus Aenigmarchaeota archaeon]
MKVALFAILLAGAILVSGCTAPAPAPPGDAGTDDLLSGEDLLSDEDLLNSELDALADEADPGLEADLGSL